MCIIPARIDGRGKNVGSVFENDFREIANFSLVYSLGRSVGRFSNESDHQMVDKNRGKKKTEQ